LAKCLVEPCGTQQRLSEIEESFSVRRWGSKLSQKLFVGKEYVVKHIRLKHTHVIDAEREKVAAPGLDIVVLAGCVLWLDI
jgi:hypothetical protein